MTDIITLPRAVIQSTVDKLAFYRGPKDQTVKALRAALAQQAEQNQADDVLKDAERLDWLDNYAHIAGWVDLEPTKMVIDAASGKWFTGDTWRDAIDAAMEVEND